MLVISKTKSEAGQYPNIQFCSSARIPDSFYWWPDTLEQATFEQYEGFVILTVARNTVVSYVPDEDAYNKWKENQGTDPEPTNDYATWSEMHDAIEKGVNTVD